MLTTATAPYNHFIAQENAAFNAIMQQHPHIDPLQILQGMTTEETYGTPTWNGLPDADHPAAPRSSAPAIKPLTRRPRPGQLFTSQTLYWKRFDLARPRNADGTYYGPFPFYGHDFIGIHAHSDRDGTTYYSYTAPTILREIAGSCYEPAFMAITFPTLGDAIAGARSICRARYIPGSEASEHNIFIVIVK